MFSPLSCVDAFTDRPYSGNPAGVCLLETPRPRDWMQQVAAEMNLAETAFVERQGDAFGLRWFTPQTEVDLCGHATLAAAHVLWTDGVVPSAEAITFHTRSGALQATSRGAWIDLDFPAEPAEASRAPAGLLEALGIASVWTGRNRMDYLVQVSSEQELRRIAPDFRALAGVECRGVIVTCRSDSPEFDFVSRFFAPRVGINEDPVTGSAHCCLAPFWANRLGKSRLAAFQASARGGVVHAELRGDRVQLSGQAVTVHRGVLLR